MTESKPNGAGPNPRPPNLKWGAIVLGVALAGGATLMIAAWMFPGRSALFFEIVALATVAAALLVRLLTHRTG